MDSDTLITRILDGQEKLRIDISDDQPAVVGFLAPITKANATDTQLIERLTEWRNRAKQHFFTQATFTYDQTAEWLWNRLLEDPTRLLFIIHAGTKAVGTVGFKTLPNRSAECGNLLRGEKGGGYKLMYFAHLAMLEWMFENLAIESAYGMVFADNLFSLNHMRSLGFMPTERIPLHRREEGNSILFEMGIPGSDSPDGRYAVKCELKRADFRSQKDGSTKSIRPSCYWAAGISGKVSVPR